ncbi:MAG: hypothetical protein ACI4B5_08015, partial [Bacteroidaceae bacterium]
MDGREQKFVPFPGLRPHSRLRSPIHASKLACTLLPIRLVCPAGRRERPKAKKQPAAVQNEPPSEATDNYLQVVNLPVLRRTALQAAFEGGQVSV